MKGGIMPVKKRQQTKQVVCQNKLHRSSGEQKTETTEVL